MSSPDGHRLLISLAVAGAIYALSLMRGPLEDALTAAVTARVDVLMQRRLVGAVIRPVGIEPLEDQDVLERLASARGELLGSQPAGAPMAVVSNLGDRLTGILACLVLATFRWYLGLGLLRCGCWCVAHSVELIRSRTTRARQAGPALRRSWYMLGLAWKPYAAKEMRVFGLADWTAERHRREWLEGMTPSWREVKRLNVRVWLAGVVVLLAYLAVALVLGRAADHREITLRTLATMLPMLPASLAAGSITLADVQLEMMLSALPDLDALVDRLGRVGTLGEAGTVSGGPSTTRRRAARGRLRLSGRRAGPARAEPGAARG